MKKAFSATIAGVDPTGASGIAADLRTFSQFDVQAGAAVTCRTIQNNIGVSRIVPSEPKQLGLEIHSIFESLNPSAIKIGLVPTAPVARIIKRSLKMYTGLVVLDPVMKASSGGNLSCRSALREMISNLFPFIHIITPNIPEAETISGIRIREPLDVILAAETILKLGPKHVLIKGGHAADSAADYLVGSDGLCAELDSPIIRKSQTKRISIRGSGCAFSSAVAAELSLGNSVFEAVCSAKRHVSALLSDSISQ